MRAALLLVVLAACPRTQSPVHTGSAAPAPDAAIAGSASPIAAPPSDAECTALIAHAVELGVATITASGPPEKVPTADEIAKIRTELDGELRPGCTGLARTAYDCAIKAATTAAMVDCEK